MNGEPLPVEHGFPVRMVVPGLYGYVSATKWVVDLELTRFDRDAAYWTPAAGRDGPVKTESRIDVPRDGPGVAAGPVAVAGVAWAQHRGIERVEVRVDGGAWQHARLADEAEHRHLAAVGLRLGRGARASTAGRARDRPEAPHQTSDRADVIPDGATG